MGIQLTNRRADRPMPRARRALALAALAASQIGLSGCGVWQSLSVRDDNAPSAALRVALRPQAWARGERAGPGFEAGYERHRADNVRTLAAGESVTVDNQVITGPDALGQRTTVAVSHVVYTHPLRFGSYFELEPFGGIANVRVRYRAEPGSTPARPELNASRGTVIGGITPRWRFNEWLALEARFAFIPLADADVYGRTLEAAAVLAPAPQVALRVGYAQRRFGAEFDAPTNWTQLDIRSRGPFATLQFEF